MEFQTLGEPERKVLLTALDIDINKLTCKFCKKSVNYKTCGIMSAVLDDVNATITCNCPLCISTYLTEQEEQEEKEELENASKIKTDLNLDEIRNLFNAVEEQTISAAEAFDSFKLFQSKNKVETKEPNKKIDKCRDITDESLLNAAKYLENNYSIGYIRGLKPNEKVDEGWDVCDGRIVKDAKSPLNGDELPNICTQYIKYVMKIKEVE